MVDLKGMRFSPFNGLRNWSGDVSVHGDVSDSVEWAENDIEQVIAYDETGDEWDGQVAGLVKLKDGRYVAWETFYGPTGHGFSEDAYGGDATIVIAATQDDANRYALTDAGRKLLGLAVPGDKDE